MYKVKKDTLQSSINPKTGILGGVSPLSPLRIPPRKINDINGLFFKKDTKDTGGRQIEGQRLACILCPPLLYSKGGTKGTQDRYEG